MSNTKIKSSQFHGVVGHGTDGYFLITNGDGSMSWVSNIVNPVISSLSYPGSATAADPAGGETITITGTGFKTGTTVTVGGTAAPSVSYVSATSLTITTPAKAAGDYDVVVTNTDGGTATSVNGISFNGIPSWTTAAGTLGTFASDTTISTITLQASEPDAGTITFSITNGALPTGLSLTGADIDGTTTLETADTLYTFTVTATDDESQATPRTFTITVTKQFINTDNFTINTYTGNGSTQSVEGKIGTAASFNSSSQGIVLPNDVIPNNDYTLSFWFQISNWVDSNYIFLPNRYGSTTFTANAAGQVIVFSRGTSSTTELNHTINFSSSTSWHNIIFSKSSTNGLVIYVDGVADYTDSNFTDDTSYYDGNNRYNAIGASWKSGSFLFGYNGKVDQVRVLSKAISSSDVTTLYGESNTSTTKSTTDIFNDGSGVALYEFEEGAKDTGGVTGYIGAGGIFNGSSSQIVVSTISNVKSYSFWINAGAIGSNYGKRLFGLDSSGYTNCITYIGNSSSSVGVVDGSGNVYYSATVSDNNWHHIVVTTNETDTLKIYTDGNLSSTNSTSYFTSSFTHIGSDNTNRQFGGKLDQIRIFNKELSSSEVTTLYGETSASATKSTTDIFSDSSGIALYELEGNANDTGGTYNGTATSVSYAYDGTATNVSFLGTSFQPDLVWIKNRDISINHALFDSIRGATQVIRPNATTANGAFSDSLTSFDSNGFSLGGDGEWWVNKSGDDYVAWCWKAGGTAVSGSGTNVSSVTQSENAAAGFGIYRFTTTSSDNTNITINHNLNATPEMVITKETSGGGNWYIYHSATGTNKYLRFTTDAATTASSVWGAGMTSSVIGAKTAQSVDSGETHVAYAFHSVDGYQKVGSYSGSNSPISITTGFKPRFLLIKRTDASGNSWVIIDSAREIGSGADALFPDLSASESSGWNTSFDSNGFTISSNESYVSASGGTYIYLAIA